jgi:hypothetical protein
LVLSTRRVKEIDMKAGITSTQPQTDPTLTIYGSKKRPPLDSSNQLEVLRHTKIHGVKLTRQVRVKMKGTDDEDGFLIRKRDFNPEKHVRL